MKFQYFFFVPLPKNHGLNKICDYAWPRFSGIYMESLLRFNVGVAFLKSVSISV